MPLRGGVARSRLLLDETSIRETTGKFPELCCWLTMAKRCATYWRGLHSQPPAFFVFCIFSTIDIAPYGGRAGG